MAISDWLDMMSATVTYAKVATRDEYGKPATYGTAASYKAHVAHKTMRVSSRVDGQDVASSTQVWINGIVAAPNVDDKLTLEDGTTPPIISWDLLSDEKGNHHQKFYLGAV